MKPISQFGTSMTQLTALITELRQVVRNLETSIEHEEQRAFVFVARHLKDRRDNLLLTISTLENHLKSCGLVDSHDRWHAHSPFRR
jgi:hypothetical protein